MIENPYRMIRRRLRVGGRGLGLASSTISPIESGQYEELSDGMVGALYLAVADAGVDTEVLAAELEDTFGTPYLAEAYLRWRREMRAHHRRDKACEEALLRRLRRRLKDAAVYRIDYTNANFRVVPQGSKYAVHLHVDPWPVASLAYYVTHVIVVDAATDGLVYETGCHSGRIDGALTKGLRTITQLPRG